MKIKSLALVIPFILAAQAHAVTHIDKNAYEKLLPRDNSEQVDYTLRLADKVSTLYHCEIKSEGGMLVLDKSNCGGTHTFDWRKQYGNVVNLDLLGDKSNETIEEHKLWAMAFAQAYVSTLVQLQYGLNKPEGTFNLNETFGTGESFGEYFARNMGPNYYVSKGLQESSLGGDIANTKEKDRDDGVLQVEYVRDQLDLSAWGGLRGVGGGGYPFIFEDINPLKILHSNTGPARNIVGSALTSAFYNAMVTGINTGSLEWDLGKTESTVSLNRFLQGAKDKDAAAKIMSFMYNRGAYAAKDQVLKNAEVFSYCQSLQDHLESDANCFVQAKDFGSKYIRQIPDVNNTLTLAALDDNHSYDAALTKTDISAYLNLLERYGFYGSEDISKAKEAALKKFDDISSGESISYRHDFGKVLEEIMINLPVYNFGEKKPIDTSKASTLKNVSDIQLFIYSSGASAYNNWVMPGEVISIMPETLIQRVQRAGDQKNNCATEVQDAFSSSGPNNILHLSLDMNNGVCTIQPDDGKDHRDDASDNGDATKTCSDYQPWSEKETYPTDTEVVYKNKVYKARWGTSLGLNLPGSKDWKGEVWQDEGACH